MKQFETIFKKLNTLVPDLDNIEEGDGIKLKTNCFMDLSINVLRRTPDKTTIAMTHYYEQNGDLVPDPDMKIAIYPSRKMAEALTYQDSFCYQEVYPEPNKVNLKVKTELNRFLNTWLNNLKLQGHTMEGSGKEGRAK